MKHLSLLVAAISLTAVAASQAAPPKTGTPKTGAPKTGTPKAGAPKTDAEKWGYSIGNQLAGQLKTEKLPVVADFVVRGLGEVQGGKTLLMTDDELNQALMQYQADRQSGKPIAKGDAGLKLSLAGSAGVLKTKADQLSYLVGVSVARSLKRADLVVDQPMFGQGLRDGLAGKKPLMTKEQLAAAQLSLEAEARKNLTAKMQKAQEQAKIQGEKNKKEGAEFLAKNKAEKDVVTTASGLQYKILKAGDGPKPTAESTVEVHYRGTLIDGKEFDSSYKRNETAKFKANQVIKGWTEALQLMPVGSKWQLFIPSELGYGERGAGEMIAPNAVLIFEVELVSIVPDSKDTKPTETKPGS